jgi:hypothetical protein
MRIHTIAAVGALLAAPAIAECQVYVTGQLGLASAEWPIGAPLNGRIDDRAVGYGVDLGVGFGRRWAFELGAYDYGEFDARGTPCGAGAVCAPVVTEFGGNDITIIKAALVPRFQVGSVWLFGTFGYYRATLDTNLGLPDSKQRDRGALLGLGARWYFSDPWSVSIQATRFDDNLQQLMVGVGWGVGRERPDRANERGNDR